MIDYAGADRRHDVRPRPPGADGRPRDQGSREIRLFNPEALDFFDATRLEVSDELAVDDGRFWIGVVTAGDGALEGDFGRVEVRGGETFACAASLPFGSGPGGRR